MCGLFLSALDLDSLLRPSQAGWAIGVLLVLLLFLSIWWRLKVGRGRRSAPTPSEIHLVPNPTASWLTKNPAKPLASVLAETGFRTGQPYLVAELPAFRLCPLWHQDPRLRGCLYEVKGLGAHFELFAAAADGTEITVTTAKVGSQLDQRPGTDKTSLPDATPAAVLETFLRKLAEHHGAGVTPVDEAGFQQNFEAAYRRDMAWRNQRGGITEAEVGRVARESGGEIPSSLQHEAFLELKREELARLHGECVAEAVRLGAIDPADPAIEAGLLFIVADSIHPQVCSEYLRSAFRLPVLPFDRPDPAGDPTPNSTLFAHIFYSLAEDRRPQALVRVQNPIRAEVWQRAA